MDEVRCGSCGESVPAGGFCVRCGGVLGDGSGGRSSGRGQFAAAPHQRLNVPRLVSTLFVHLPRDSMHGFRVALGAGVAVVVVLAAFRLFPAALIAAAVLVPALTLLYLYDVNVYEDEPFRILGLTMAAGAAAGVVVGLLARSLGDSGVAVLTASTGHIVLVQGVLLPLLGVVLMLVGPLFLLRYRRFNDVLDGVSFGATTAAAFGGALAITYGASLLGAGLRPTGAVGPWIVRLLATAVASPVLTMAAIGTACAALWLRYRAPVRDRAELGLLGNPLVAVPAAALVIVAGSALEPLVAVGWWLAGLVVLDALALIGLRRAIHVGLLEEASEIAIGPPITCPNCKKQTPAHTFCIDCGIALQALPKPPTAQQPAPPTPAMPAGPTPGDATA